jgi:hypothetical protein
MTCYWLFGYVQNGSRLESAGKELKVRLADSCVWLRLIGFQGIIRSSCLRVKYPSSYPDFKMLPFFTTTLSLPENRRWRRSFSVAADSSRASLVMRRNSVKLLSSAVGSVSFIPCFTSARTAEPSSPRLWHGGIPVVNKNIALRRLLKYMYCFQQISSR